jgi:FkbM family methyltransferase
MISYAQNFEDVILKRALRDIDRGRYIDIGANDPDRDSVSKAFYLEGWRGVHVEPIAAFAQALRKARPDETVIEAAVTTSSGPIEMFDVEGTGLSTGDERFAARHRAAGFSVASTQVVGVTLSSILTNMGDAPIHWLKIDVEGMEKDVLASWGDAPQRPWIVVVESTLPNSPVENQYEWEDELIHRDYRMQYFDGLNRFYIHQDQSSREKFFGPGPNPFDDFTLSSTSPYVGMVKEEAQSLGVQLQRDFKIAQHEAMVRERDLQARLAQVYQDLGEARSELAAARQEAAGLNAMIAELNIWRAIYPFRWLLLPDGTPRYLVRRALFHSSGRPRRLTSPLVIRSNGVPRAAFRPWMTSAAYTGMRRPYQVPDMPVPAAVRRGAFGRLLLRRDGRPRSLIRRVLFHNSGKARGAFRKIVLRPDGIPRSLFRVWMDSPAYMWLRKAHHYNRGLARQGTIIRQPWWNIEDKDELSENDLTDLMNRIREELKREAS